MIHDSVIIRGNVTIGERVTIEPYAIITGPCTIGNDVFIGAYAIIGGDAQFRGIYPSPTTADARRCGVESNYYYRPGQTCRGPTGEQL
jgi:UDP-N-acetylglucosamine acyltransferase